MHRRLGDSLEWAAAQAHRIIHDINTRWSSHEPASILHELVFHENYAAMQFLIDRGIEMTIVDYRWGATAEGWAYHASQNEKLARWLADAQRSQARR